MEIEQSYLALDRLFRDNNFPELEAQPMGLRYLKIRSFSRNSLMESFFEEYEINTPARKREYATTIFNSRVSNEELDNFIRRKYEVEKAERANYEEDLVDQLARVQVFDWGGSFQNALEKNIVDNYVKKIKTYDGITQAISEPILESVRGYTINSWYNHWSAILIEDIFKDHPSILPTVGRVEKIDFFINNIPFDLKVTYFPDELMKTEFASRGYGVELTLVKRKCRELGISIPADLKGKSLLIHLYNKLSEDIRANDFIEDIRRKKRTIIREYKQQPQRLKVWLYENQGEKRFDASNRLFLVLTDEDNFFDSWKLKRQIPFLKEQIQQHLDRLVPNDETLRTRFHWALTNQDFECKSDIIFINKTSR